MWKEKNLLKGKEYVVKTIVTTELIAEIAKAFKVEYYDVLTGFKYIAAIIKENEGKKTFIVGGEESYGYLAGDFVRDKDAIMSCALIAETAAWAFTKKKTLWDVLLDIYKEYGYYQEDLINITKKGKQGADEIRAMMDGYRKNPPLSIGNSKVLVIKDYLSQLETDLQTKAQKAINLPQSNVLQFITEDETKISVRPSGTEPKIKFYLSVKADINKLGSYEAAKQSALVKIDLIKTDLSI
jgi:phosphoglucomutase